MQNKPPDKTFDILIGQKLSSVVFVMDYLQIDFDGNRFTMNIWPVITVDNLEYKFGNSSYRDKLCFLIAKSVTNVSYVKEEKIIIDFEDKNSIFLSLNPHNPDIVTPEIATFEDTNKQWYVF